MNHILMNKVCLNKQYLLSAHRKRARTRCRSRMPYEQYFKVASDSLILTDNHDRILEINLKAELLFGYSQNELVGRPVEILLPDGALNRAMRIGQHLVGRRKNGSEFPVEVNLTDTRSLVRGDLRVATVIDITERLALEAEVRRAENLTSLGAIAAGIAHDLNNPLQVILSRIELLAATPEGALAPQTREDLAVVLRHAQRAARIIEEFLQLSRLRKKRLGEIDLNQLVGRTLMLMNERLRMSGIGVETILDANLPPTVGDGTALERVLINLITNACDAMTQGGTVRIESEALSDRPGWLQLTVADTGLGIRPEVLSKIFDLLYTTKADGTGLGLWLSKRIVQEHNGNLQVQSELGKGTTFALTLPASDVLMQA